MFLLDTNVVSELRKAKAGKADPHVVAWAGTVSAGSLFISVVTILELELGILQLNRRDPAQGDILRQWFNGHVMPAFDGRIIPIDTTIAITCARLHVPYPRAERDALIAATGLVNELTVVTRNIPDFQSTGVRLINPWATQSV